MLACCGSDSPNGIPPCGGLFEPHRFGGGIHLAGEFLKQRYSVAVEDPAGGVDSFSIACGIDARSCTEADVHREATLGEQFFAITDSKLPTKELHDLFCCSSVGKRPPSQAAFGWVSGVHDAWNFFFCQH